LSLKISLKAFKKESFRFSIAHHPASPQSRIYRNTEKKGTLQLIFAILPLSIRLTEPFRVLIRVRCEIWILGAGAMPKEAGNGMRCTQTSIDSLNVSDFHKSMFDLSSS
jgi:hypothetical protein